MALLRRICGPHATYHDFAHEASLVFNTMSGYSVKQLLKWTIEDHLVDSYSVDERGEYNIRMHGESIHLPPEEARKLLIALLRGKRSAPNPDESTE